MRRMPLYLKKTLLVCCVFFSAHAQPLTEKERADYRYLLLGEHGSKQYTDDSLEGLVELKKLDYSQISALTPSKQDALAKKIKTITGTSIKSSFLSELHGRLTRATPTRVQATIASREVSIAASALARKEAASKISAEDRAKAENIHRVREYVLPGGPRPSPTSVDERRTTPDGKPFDYAGFQDLLFDEHGRQMFTDESLPHLVNLFGHRGDSFAAISKDVATQIHYHPDYIEAQNERLRPPYTRGISNMAAQRALYQKLNLYGRRDEIKRKMQSLSSLLSPSRLTPTLSPALPAVATPSPRLMTSRRPNMTGSGMATPFSPAALPVERLGAASSHFQSDASRAVGLSTNTFDRTGSESREILDNALGKQATEIEALRRRVAELEAVLADSERKRHELELEITPLRQRAAANAKTQADLEQARAEIERLKAQLKEMTATSESAEEQRKKYQRKLVEAQALTQERDAAKAAAKSTRDLEATIRKLTQEAADAKQAADEAQRKLTADLEASRRSVKQLTATTQVQEKELARLRTQAEKDRATIEDLKAQNRRIQEEHTAAVRRTQSEHEAQVSAAVEAKRAAMQHEIDSQTQRANASDDAAQTATRRASELEAETARLRARALAADDAEVSVRRLDQQLNAATSQVASLTAQLAAKAGSESEEAAGLRGQLSTAEERALTARSEHEAQVSAAVEEKRATMQRDIDTQTHKATASDEAARVASQRAIELEAEATRFRARASAADDAEASVRRLQDELSSATSQVATLKEQLATRAGTESEAITSLRRQLSTAEERVRTARKELEDQAAAHRRALDKQADTNREALAAEADRTSAALSRASAAEARISSTEEATRSARTELDSQSAELSRLRDVEREIAALRTTARTHAEYKESAERNAKKISILAWRLSTSQTLRSQEKAALKKAAEEARQAAQQARDDARATQSQFERERKAATARHVSEADDLRGQLEQARENQRRAQEEAADSIRRASEAEARARVVPVDRVVERITPGPADPEALRTFERQLEAARHERTDAIREAQRRADEAVAEAQRRARDEIVEARQRADAEILRTQTSTDAQVAQLQAAQALELERMRASVDNADTRSREAIERFLREKDTELARARDAQAQQLQHLELAKAEELRRLTSDRDATIARLHEDHTREAARFGADKDAEVQRLRTDHERTLASLAQEKEARITALERDKVELTREKDERIRATEEQLAHERERTAQLTASSLARGADGRLHSPRGRGGHGMGGVDDGGGTPPISVVVHPAAVPNINVHVDAPHITLSTPAPTSAPAADQTLLIQSLQERLHTQEREASAERDRFTATHREEISRLEAAHRDAQRAQDQAAQIAHEASRGFERQIAQIQAETRATQATSVAESAALRERLATLQAQKDAVDRDVIRLTADGTAKDLAAERLRGELATSAERYRGDLAAKDQKIKSAQSKARSTKRARDEAQRLRENAEGERDVMRERAHALEVDHAHLRVELRLQQDHLHRTQEAVALAEAEVDQLHRALREHAQRETQLEGVLHHMTAEKASENSAFRQELKAARMAADHARDETAKSAQQLAERNNDLKIVVEEKLALTQRVEAAEAEVRAARGRLSQADPAAGLRPTTASLVATTAATDHEAREDEFKRTALGSYESWTIPFPRQGGTKPTLSSDGRQFRRLTNGSSGEDSGQEPSRGMQAARPTPEPFARIPAARETYSSRSRFIPVFVPPKSVRKFADSDRTKEILAQAEADARRSERMMDRIRAKQAATASQAADRSSGSDAKDSLQARINEIAKKLASDDASLDVDADRPGTRPEDVVHTYTRRQVLIDQLKALHASYVHAFGSDTFITSSQSFARQHEAKTKIAKQGTSLGTAAAAKISEKRTPKTSSRAELHRSIEHRPAGLGDAFRAQRSATRSVRSS